MAGVPGHLCLETMPLPLHLKFVPAEFFILYSINPLRTAFIFKILAAH